MWTTIKQLVSSGSTILLTTQYLDEADHLADRIAVIDHGRVVAEGTPTDLKAEIGIATLHLRLAAWKDNEEAMRLIENVLQVKASTTDPAVITAPMADPEKVTDLLVALRGAGIRLAEISVQEPTLDEVFMVLTGETKLVEQGVN
jgi:ABC-2 type transport system ATP-binding protein